jgi:hypothetical protein
MMRLIFATMTMVVLTTPASAQSGVLSLFIGGGGLGIGELEDFDPQLGGYFLFGAAYDGVGSGDAYVGFGLEMDIAYDWTAFAAELDFGIGSASSSASTVSTPFFGLRGGYVSGTYTRPKDVQLYGGIFDVENDISGFTAQLVLGYRMISVVGFSIDVAPGFLYVNDQDPEVVEAQVGKFLPLVQLRIRFAFLNAAV